MRKHRLLQLLELVPPNAEIVIQLKTHNIPIESDFTIVTPMGEIEGPQAILVPTELAEVYEDG